MQTRCTLRCFTALVLSVLLITACFPISALAQEAADTTEEITTAIIPEDPEVFPEESAEASDVEITEPPDTSSADTDLQVQGEEITSFPTDEKAMETETTVQYHEIDDDKTETVPVDSEEQSQVDESDEGVSGSTDMEETEPTAEGPDVHIDERKPLQAAIEDYGHVYVSSVRKTTVYSSPILKTGTAVYTTSIDAFLFLATKYTKHNTVVVWFLDLDGQVVNGFVDAYDLNEQYLLDGELKQAGYLPSGRGMTSVGLMDLFMADGFRPLDEESPSDDAISDAGNTDPQETATAEAYPVFDTAGSAEVGEDPEELVLSGSNESIAEYTEQELPTDPPDEEVMPTVPGTESKEENPESTEAPSAEEELQQLAEAEQSEPAHAAAGSYIGVTAKTRVFARIDPQASEIYYSNEYLGNFTKDAAVQILSVEINNDEEAWYHIRFMYGDDFPNGRLKWTDYGTAWVMSAETVESGKDSYTVTDFAYTKEYLQTNHGSRRALLSASKGGIPLINLKPITGNFYAGQSGIYGSTGIDSDTPQLARSASYGTIYASPHYLVGFRVYCLEHTLPGPGEGTGYEQTPKGPYELIDLETYLNRSFHFRASTMHAIGWVLRHSRPFMTLNLDDSNNSAWCYAACQYAIREVIKQMEGASFVRSYWDMSSFYSYNGGAPAEYLEYARWLANNAIAYSGVKGDIIASNQSLTFDGSKYVGTVTLTTDADVIRISREVGSITGNSGGSDDSYYFVKSGDTIHISFDQSSFTVYMESLRADTEEANFLIAIPSESIQQMVVPIKGSPNILNKGTLSFEPGIEDETGKIIITKESQDGRRLVGAEFELLDSSGEVIATAITSQEGTAEFTDLQPGVYVVREKTAPQGYWLTTSEQSVWVDAGKTSNLVFINSHIMGIVRIHKTDSETEMPLPGAVFTVTCLSSDNAADIGKIVATITTDPQGFAETGLLPGGEYQIIEAAVPEGYIDSGYTTTVWIK